MLQDKFSVFMCYFAFIVSVARLFTEIALYGALHYVHINVLVQQRWELIQHIINSDSWLPHFHSHMMIYSFVDD